VKTLVIDDDEGTRLILRTLLEARGHEVAACSSAEEAMPRCEGEFVPLIFLDLFLPGMSGFDFCRWLRRQPDGDRSYVLAGTSSDRPEDLQRILEAGANDYLHKPYEPELLSIRLQVAAQQIKNLAARRQLEADLRKERERLAYLASHDPLTRLGNRAALATELESAIHTAASGTPAALVYLDLDNFKIVNDTVGHAAGDRLLSQMAFLFKNAVRLSDGAFRFGGDEFVLLLRGTPPSEAMAVAERIRAAVEDFTFSDADKTFRLGASIGIAEIDGTMNSEEVMAAADSACYRAKARGRNRVAVHHPGDDTIAHLRQDTHWAARIKDALRQEAFTLLFQPIVDLRTAETAMHEVLLRMHGEAEVLIPPGSFLPPAERFRLMPEIDRHVIVHTTARMRRDPALRVAINISGQSFADAGLPDFIEETFAVAAVDPSRAIFEVTETAVISNLGAAKGLPARLREKGFRFALDDFGAGFSSFSYLKSLPVDFLKIDGSFTRDSQREPANWIFIEVMNNLAHSLGLRSIAESVEDEATARRLREMGVDCAQGWFFGKPDAEPRAARG
jgi:diguanylate cyclase (GGDEF)-like protein